MLVRIEQIPDQGLWLAGTTAAGTDVSEDGSVSLPGPIVFSVKLTRHGEQAEGRGWLHAVPQVRCSRCLCPTARRVDREFSLHLLPLAAAPKQSETELDGSDLDVDYYEGDSIDLRAVLVEQVMLDLPMKSLCSEECLGLCPQCGGNRNEQSCDCEPSTDPRLSALAELRDRVRTP